MLYIETMPHGCSHEGFYLMMNPVYDRAEAARAFGPFDTLQEAVDYYNSQLIRDVENNPTTESKDGDPYIRSFIPGPLRNMNRLELSDLAGDPGPFNHGVVQLRPVKAVEWLPGNQVIPPQF